MEKFMKYALLTSAMIPIVFAYGYNYTLPIWITGILYFIATWGFLKCLFGNEEIAEVLTQ